MVVDDGDGVLFELPRVQYHEFVEWAVSPDVCGHCGQLRQAHPLPRRTGQEGRGDECLGTTC